MYQQKMLHKSIQAQENERKISRELHDSVIQEMLNIDVELRLLKYKYQDENLVDSAQHIEGLAQHIEGLVSQLIDIRNLSVELRPSSLDDLGIEAAFNSYFKQFEEIMVFKLIINLISKVCVLIMRLKRWYIV